MSVYENNILFRKPPLLGPPLCANVGRPSCGYPPFQGAQIRYSGEIRVRFR